MLGKFLSPPSLSPSLSLSPSPSFSPSLSISFPFTEHLLALCCGRGNSDMSLLLQQFPKWLEIPCCCMCGTAPGSPSRGRVSLPRLKGHGHSIRMLRSSVSFSCFQGPDSWGYDCIPTSGLLVSELVYYFPVQTRHDASVKYMSTKSAFTISAFLKVRSEMSHAPKQELAVSASVLLSLTMPCCHLELNLGCGYGSGLLKPCPCGDWAEVVSSTMLLGSASACPPGF